jgi:aminoacyl tRNA synthase complex-interacting multifunctional protein 1
VEILYPPEDSQPGDLVTVSGFERKPDAQLNPKKKIFETCAPDLKVDGSGVATYKGVPWTVNGKHCKSKTLKDVIVK